MNASHRFPRPADLVGGALLSRHSVGAIESAIEVLVDLLDLLGGDPDFEGEDPDLEEDDPVGQCDEDGVNTLTMADWSDELAQEEQAYLAPCYGIDQTKPPAEFDASVDRRLMRSHRDRIREMACEKVGWRTWSRDPVRYRYELCRSDAVTRKAIIAEMKAHGWAPHGAKRKVRGRYGRV